MFELDRVLTTSEAQAWIDAAEAMNFERQGSGGAAAGEAFRDHCRVTARSPGAARQMWERSGMRDLFSRISVDGGEALGLSGNLRLYRYAGGGRERFGRHVDGAKPDEAEVVSAADASADAAEGGKGGGGARLVAGVTGYTVLIYLSGGGGGGGGKQEAAASPTDRVVVPRADQRFLGGETKFYRGSRLVASVAPVAGKALCHLHGYDRCLEHEAAAVASAGTKYVLRSDVVFAAPPPPPSLPGTGRVRAAAAAAARGGGGGAGGGAGGRGRRR